MSPVSADLTDEEIIKKIHAGEEELMVYLLDKYKALVRKKAGGMFLLGGDRDDLLQEGMIGLYRAVRDYDETRGAQFSTFAELCVSRQIFTAVEASTRKKNLPLNSYISLNSQDEEGVSEEILGSACTDSEGNPEQLLLIREQIDKIREAATRELSPFEKQVYNLLVKGLGYTDIAGILNRDVKSVDNAIFRIKRKLAKVLGHDF